MRLIMKLISWCIGCMDWRKGSLRKRNNMNLGICRLCGEYKELCKKSHIIGNSNYKFLRDKETFLYVDKRSIRASENRQRRYTGEFEGGILCTTCDNERIGNLETYASSLRDSRIKNTKREKFEENGVMHLRISGAGYDYIKYKLNLLSILWRASISSRAFFKDVILDIEDEERIRKMILDNNPGEVYDYPCCIISPALMCGGIGYSLQDVGFIRSPFSSERKGIKIVNLVISGFHYNIGITTMPNAFLNDIISIQKENLIIKYQTTDQTIAQRKSMKDLFD